MGVSRVVLSRGLFYASGGLAARVYWGLVYWGSVSRTRSRSVLPRIACLQLMFKKSAFVLSNYLSARSRVPDP